ncbi:hypothetical protein GQ42DRAFT_164236, partial [Ramicandelaber brevisporus]
MSVAYESRFASLNRVLSRRGPFSAEHFAPGQEAADALKLCKLLVIGAGGLGCELLKDLALAGFTDLHVIDMDTIDVSNLNRQFLFRRTDVGKAKAEVAAAFVQRRVPTCKITPHVGRIQDKDDDFYRSFTMIVCGLDSVEARRWINAKIFELLDDDDDDSLKIMIDGGTEGFRGHARVIIPMHTACYECTIDLIPPQTRFPICTIANTPRLPEHCIEWAAVIEWPRVFPAKKIDGDDPDHIRWIATKAGERAAAHGIDGVNYALAQGVVKNIIPAIASTNAVIAAACAAEAVKLATHCNPYIEDYMMFNGGGGIYSLVIANEKRSDCPICGEASTVHSAKISATSTVADFIDWLRAEPKFQLRRPSITGNGRTIFMQAPPSLNEATKPNLERLLSELAPDGTVLTITDPGLALSL